MKGAKSTSAPRAPHTHPGRFRSAEEKSDDSPVPGVILDLAPPFALLEWDDFAGFKALVRKFGVEEIRLDQRARESFFFEASDRVRSYYVAPRAAIEKAAGELDPYFSCGFVEDRLPSQLNHPKMLEVLRASCGLLQAKIGRASAHPIPASTIIRNHLENVLATHRSRFLDHQILARKPLTSVRG